MNSSKKIKKGQIEDFISDSTQNALNNKQDNLNAINLGQIIYDELAIKATPSPDDEIVMYDSITGEAVTAKFSDFGGDFTNIETTANKTDVVIGNETSSIKYPSIKGLVDWVTSLFVPKTRTLTIGGVTQDLSENRTFTVSGGKRTVNYTYEFNGVLNTATNNWWGAQLNGTPSLLVQSATLTPTNNFSSALVQSAAWVVPFNCRLKSIIFKGFSNTGSGTVDLAFSSGSYLGNGSNLVNNTILSNQPFVIHNYLGVSNFSDSLYVFDTGFTNYTIPKGYEIRMFMNNRNVAINLLSTTIMIEFEEVL